MKRSLIALACTVALTGAAFATETKSGPGASDHSPGHEMQDKGSKAGSPGASGYAPGQEKKSDSSSTSSGSDSKSRTSGSGSK